MQDSHIEVTQGSQRVPGQHLCGRGRLLHVHLLPSTIAGQAPSASLNNTALLLSTVEVYLNMKLETERWIERCKSAMFKTLFSYKHFTLMLEAP